MLLTPLYRRRNWGTNTLVNSQSGQIVSGQTRIKPWQPVFLITISYSWIRCMIVAMSYGPLSTLAMIWNPNIGEGEFILACTEVHLDALWITAIRNGKDTVRCDTCRKRLTHVFTQHMLDTLKDIKEAEYTVSSHEKLRIQARGWTTDTWNNYWKNPRRANE